MDPQWLGLGQSGCRRSGQQESSYLRHPQCLSWSVLAGARVRNQNQVLWHEQKCRNHQAKCAFKPFCNLRASFSPIYSRILWAFYTWISVYFSWTGNFSVIISLSVFSGFFFPPWVPIMYIWVLDSVPGYQSFLHVFWFFLPLFLVSGWIAAFCYLVFQ